MTPPQQTSNGLSALTISNAMDSPPVMISPTLAAPLRPPTRDERLAAIRSKKAYLIDMDGVIYHGNKLLPGAKEFIQWMCDNDKMFIFVTNNSIPTPRELREKLMRFGINVPESQFYTSAMCTAKFLSKQKPGGSCFVIGEAGLHFALYSAGLTMDDRNPDWVVIGDGFGLNYEKMAKAVKLVNQGAALIGTNPDINAVTEDTLIPACGSFVSSIEAATGKKAFFLGKPSSLMLRGAQRILNLARHEVCMIGDRMDTDILGGIYAELDTVLVLTGVTKQHDLKNFSYAPFLVMDAVGELVGEFEKRAAVAKKPASTAASDASFE